VPESFEVFFEEHSLKVFGAMCLVSGNRQEAEEIAQDAFLKVWERLDRVSRLEDPVGFLFRTAMNVFRDRARRASLAARRTLGLAERTDDLAAVEDRNELVRVMRRLTPHQRAALVLTGYLGYSSEEAAEILGVRASTVRALATKGRSMARATVEWRR
jgi:RNA polymerase sigma-70 factor (ECF subfamily)